MIKFIIGTLVCKYIESEEVTDAYLGNLFDQAHILYYDSHTRKMKDKASSSKKQDSNVEIMHTYGDKYEEIEKLKLPQEVLKHIDQILTNVDEQDHKNFIRYMTKTYYQKTVLRLRYLIMKYMPHIKADELYPRYKKAIIL